MLTVKRDFTKNSSKYLIRSIIVALVILPGLIIMTPACNPFGKCGKPGYRLSGYCNDGLNNDYIYYDCDSPCTPSVSHTVESFTSGTHYSTTTVYCEDSSTMGYDTSDGIKVGWTCP